MMELMYFLVGLVVAFGFWFFSSQREESRERVRTLVRRVAARLRRVTPPAIGPVLLRGADDYRQKPVRVGGLVLPLRIFLGGDGKTRYAYPDGIVCNWSASKLELPADLAKALPGFVDKRREQALARGAVFVQRDHARLDDYDFGMSDIDDAPYPLRLHMSTTDYHIVQGTNASIDETLPGGATIREKYASDPGELRHSVLANPLAVNLSIVTSDRQIYVTVRSRRTATNPEGFAPAVSGTGNPRTDCDAAGNFSPFLAAQREAAEEQISYKPELSEITFFGLARTLKYQYPFLFGELRLAHLSSATLESLLPRDKWESEALIAIPFEIPNVLEFIRRVYSELDPRLVLDAATYTAIFSLLQSLLYEYPDQWERVVRELSSIPALVRR